MHLLDLLSVFLVKNSLFDIKDVFCCFLFQTPAALGSISAQGPGRLPVNTLSLFSHTKPLRTSPYFTSEAHTCNLALHLEACKTWEQEEL